MDYTERWAGDQSKLSESLSRINADWDDALVRAQTTLADSPARVRNSVNRQSLQPPEGSSDSASSVMSAEKPLATQCRCESIGLD